MKKILLIIISVVLLLASLGLFYYSYQLEKSLTTKINDLENKLTEFQQTKENIDNQLSSLEITMTENQTALEEIEKVITKLKSYGPTGQYLQ